MIRKPRFRLLPLIDEREREGKPYVALISDLTVRRDIPHEKEKGEWMELRHLTRVQLRHAADTRTYSSLDVFKRLGADGQAAINELNARREDDDVVAAGADPLTSFDIDTLLCAGIAAWSYKNQLGQPIEVTYDAIERLDAETAEWAARELLKIAGIGETETTRKNGSKPSTATSRA